MARGDSAAAIRLPAALWVAAAIAHGKPARKKRAPQQKGRLPHHYGEGKKKNGRSTDSSDFDEPHASGRPPQPATTNH